MHTRPLRKRHSEPIPIMAAIDNRKKVVNLFFFYHFNLDSLKSLQLHAGKLNQISQISYNYVFMISPFLSWFLASSEPVFGHLVWSETTGASASVHSYHLGCFKVQTDFD